MWKKLTSISNIEVIEDRRKLTTFDEMIELIFDNLKKVDNIKSFHYEKNKFEAIIFDFVKNEHSIYIGLNSKYLRNFKGISDVQYYNEKIKILDESLEDYNKFCYSFFDKELTLVFRCFLNKLSDKLIGYTNSNPTLENKKQTFENILNEMKQENLKDIEIFIKAIDKYRE